MMTSEDVFPVIDLQVQDFTRIYKEAKVTNLRTSTRDAIVQLLNDSVKLIVSSRELNAEEKNAVQKNELDVASTKIAYDGVAVIVNSQNTITDITVDDLRAILTGRKERWKGIAGSNLSSAVVTGIGDRNSGVYEYIKHRVANDSSFGKNTQTFDSTESIIGFVRKYPNAIGFVGLSWLSGEHDGIKVLNIGDPNFKSDSTKTELEFFSPHPANIYRNFYPLGRAIFIYVHNAGHGVALGFSSFAAGNIGQKIIVKNGLVPATLPVRLVQLNNQSEKEE